MTIAALMLSGLSSYDRARVACDTWGKDFEILEVHSFATETDLPLRICGIREGPRSCFLKRLCGLPQALVAWPEADWFLCGSDDAYFWRENLERVLAKIDSTKWVLVGGHTNKLRIANGTIVTYPSGGAGYVLSRPALDLIVCCMRHHDLVGQWNAASNGDDVEDAFIGFSAEKLNIPYLETPGFFGCNPLLGNCERGCVMPEKPISIHYATVEQMRSIRAAAKLKHV